MIENLQRKYGCDTLEKPIAVFSWDITQPQDIQILAKD